MITSMEETTMWKGCRSQITNGGVYAVCLLVLIGVIVGGSFMPLIWLGAALPLLWAAWVWIATAAEGFELTTERLRMKRGVFSQVFDEVELYRVKDVSLSRSVFERMLGLGTVTLETSDRGQEHLSIPSVRKSDELREHLRTQVEIVRDRKRVREIDTADSEMEPS
jgi:uncharacterized membrane protein YdbT with pleckstrin-like domain